MNLFYKKVYDVLKEKNADAVVVSGGANMRYLSGFRGATGYLYISGNRQVLLTDSRYTTMAKAEAEAFEVVEISAAAGYGKLIAGLIEADGAERVGYEDQVMLCADYAALNEAGGRRLNVPLGNSLDLLRCVKTEEELELLAKAEEIGDLAFSHILTVLKPGLTEIEVAAELEYFMKRNGAEELSFPSIVASGENSAMPHAMPGSRKLQNGDFVTMDFGCVYQGYCSDMTRTVMIGKADEKQKAFYNVVLKAQLAALDSLKAGKKGCEVDAVARTIIADAGYGEYFGHGLGHSVGLQIHEWPRLSPNDSTVLVPNMIETVEPGIYLPGVYGVRIEDMVVVTEDGYRNLAHSPKELIEVG
ncbi:MAG: aminopeptidase P family protein [Eubacteriales bacterium]|nr:aminopeptidase P family protein [Eubacteriales bacterium]